MKKSVLILNERLGPPFEGGVPAAAFLLASLLQSFDVNIYCTAFTVSEEGERKAEQFDVKLLFPKGRGRFEHREGVTSDAFILHDYYFPKLKSLQNVKLIFGFGMVSSDGAIRIKNDIFPQASFYLINVWSLDVIKSNIIGCQNIEKQDRQKSLLKHESNQADGIFSVGPKTFHCFDVRYGDGNRLKHSQIIPLIEQELWNPPTPREQIYGKREIQIISVMQECNFVEEVDRFVTLCKSVSAAANDLAENNIGDVTWKIMGVPSGREDDLISLLKPHPKLSIMPVSNITSEDLLTELGCSRLALIPPSILSLQFTLISMATETPVLFNWGSDSHCLIKEKDNIDTFVNQEYMATVMSEEDTLTKAIKDILCKPRVYRAKALELKQSLRAFLQDNPNNRKFVEDIKRHLDQTKKFEYESVTAGSDDRNKTKSTAHNIKYGRINETRTKQRRKYGRVNETRTKHRRFSREIGIRLNVTSGIPDQDETMYNIIERLFKKDRHELKEALGKLAEMHPDVIPKRVDNECKTLVVECKSIEALECIEVKYRIGILHSTIEEIVVKPSVLKEIGAQSLKLTTTTDYGERMVCRQELMSERKMTDDSGKHDEIHLGANTASQRIQIDNYAGKRTSTDKGKESEIGIASLIRRFEKSGRDDASSKSGNTDVYSSTVEGESKSGEDGNVEIVVKTPQIAEQVNTDICTPVDKHILVEEIPGKNTEIVGVSGSPIKRAKVIYDFTPQLELEMKVDDIIEVTVKEGEHWWTGKLHGKVGEFPSSYVESVNEDKHIYKVIHSYQPPNKLHLKVGDIIEVTHEDTSEWWTGLLGGKCGLFPSTFTEMIADNTDGNSSPQPVIPIREPIEPLTITPTVFQTDQYFTRSRTSILEENQEEPTPTFGPSPRGAGEYKFKKGLPRKGTIHKFTGEGTQHGKLQYPRGLFHRNNGDFVLCDCGNSRILVLDCELNCKSVIQFNSFDKSFHPIDVVVSNNDIFYITDSYNNSLVICTEKCKIIKVLQLTYQGKHIIPYAVCLSMGYIYITDGWNDCVHCIDGKSYKVIKSSHQLTSGWCLHSICVNTKGHFMISDLYNNCIHILDKDLNQLTTLTHQLLQSPQGLCLDQFDNLYVCEGYDEEGKLLKFNSQGEFVSQIADSEVFDPHSIVVTDDIIAWTEWRGHCVKILYR